MTYKPIVGVGPDGRVACDDAPDSAEIALLGATTAAMNLYVDPVLGLDTNPGTASWPFRTIAAALAAVPQTIKHVVTVNLVAGNYAEPIEIIQHAIDSGKLLIVGTPVVNINGTTGTKYGDAYALVVLNAAGSGANNVTVSNVNLVNGGSLIRESVYYGPLDPTLDWQLNVVYVRIAGNDITGDGTAAHPYRTLKRALEHLPEAIGNSYWTIDITGITENINPGFSINMASNVEQGYDSYATLQWMDVVYPLSIIATPTTVDTMLTPTNAAVPTLGWRTYTQAGKAWGIDSLKGKFVRRTAPPAYSGTFQSGVIISNTGDTITVASGILLTGALTIFEPSASLTISASVLDRPWPLAAIDVNGFGQITFCGVNIGNSTDAPYSIRALGPAISVFWGKVTGFINNGETSGVSRLWSSEVTGHLVFRGSAPDIESSYVHNTTLSNYGDGSHGQWDCHNNFIESCDGWGHVGNSQVEGSFDMVGCWIKSGSAVGLTYLGGSPSSFVNGRIDSCVGAGVHADGVGKLSLSNVIGTGNSLGVSITDGGKVNVSGVTLTGTTGNFKSGNRPIGTWADLATYGPDDDGADQKLVRAVPANPGPWTIALGVALNGMLASGLVRVHDLTSGAVLAEVAPAPGAGQFSVDYATGVITFNTLQQTDNVAIYYRPVSYTGARIG